MRLILCSPKGIDLQLIYIYFFSAEGFKIKQHYILKRKPEETGKFHQVLKLSTPANSKKDQTSFLLASLKNIRAIICI